MQDLSFSHVTGSSALSEGGGEEQAFSHVLFVLKERNEKKTLRLCFLPGVVGKQSFDTSVQVSSV